MTDFQKFLLIIPIGLLGATLIGLFFGWISYRFKVPTNITTVLSVITASIFGSLLSISIFMNWWW